VIRWRSIIEPFEFFRNRETLAPPGATPQIPVRDLGPDATRELKPRYSGLKNPPVGATGGLSTSQSARADRPPVAPDYS
jgi:hypothetical protein